MAVGGMEWQKYVHEGNVHWWWCETTGDWFLEASPEPWSRYLDPTSKRQYWWRDDTNWFWINGCHGEAGHSLTEITAADDTSALKSSAALQLVEPREAADFQWSTSRAEHPPHPPALAPEQSSFASEVSAPQKAKRLEEVAPPSSPQSATLLGDSAPAGVAWQYPLRDETQHSYVGYLPGGISSKDAKEYLYLVMDGMDEMGWERPPADRRSGSSGGGGANRGVIGRCSKWLVREGCYCSYRHETVSSRTSKATPFPSWMNKLMQACMPACGLEDPAMWPNSCILNRYNDGSQAIDWHCDNEPLFGGLSKTGERIISLVLGSERLYEMRPSDSPMYEDNVPLSCSLRLKSGDIFSMEGQTPKYYMHRVPRYAGKKGETVSLHVSLTWRWIVTHESTRCCARSY